MSKLNVQDFQKKVEDTIIKEFSYDKKFNLSYAKNDLTWIHYWHLRESSKENFEKPPKTSRYAPKVYKEWGGKRGKSKFSKVVVDKLISEVKLRDYIEKANVDPAINDANKEAFSVLENKKI